MGVLGLTPFLQKACPTIFERFGARFQGLSGKTVVFDGTLITLRFYFASMPQTYRHVLGWYRMLHELKDCGVSAVCVFDGKYRSLAKQLEVDRRREARKLIASRGQLELERLNRLSMLSNVMKTWSQLDGLEKESAAKAFRDAVPEETNLSSSFVPTGKLYIPPPIEANSNTFRPEPQGYNQYDFSEDNVSAEDLEDVLECTGVPVSTLGRFDADISSTVPSHLSPLGPLHHNVLEEQLGVLPDPGGLITTTENESQLVLENLEQDVASLAQPAEAEDVGEQPHVGQMSRVLAELYAGYRASHTQLQSLSRSTPPSHQQDSDSSEDAQKEYFASKAQAQLTLEEGDFWAQLRDPTTLNETINEKSAGLLQESRLLSESYSRRTSLPTARTYDECKEIIRAMGVPCVETDGPFEAEALAASIVIHGQADFVASEDTDVLVYGAPLMRNVAKSSDELVVLRGSDVRRALGLDEDRFIDFALLLGTDFSRRIKNIGPARALKFIREYGSIEEILEREAHYSPHDTKAIYLQQVELARAVFQTLPPVPDRSLLQNQESDDAAVEEILRKYRLWKDLSHDSNGTCEPTLSGNYFDDNPAVA